MASTVYPASGDIIDAKAKTVVAGLTDEYGRSVQGEKAVEVDFATFPDGPLGPPKGKVLRVGNRFGVGQAPTRQLAKSTDSSGGR